MRKTVTISRTIFEMLKEINSNDRHIIWDMILDSLFDGKKPQINGDDIHSDSIRNAFICLNHELNILQKQFDNGKKSVQKNSKQKNTGLFCPLDDPQIDPIQPTLPQADSSDYYNIIYIIKKIIYNNQSISQTTDFKFLKYDKMGQLNQSLEQIEKVCESKGIKKIAEVVQKLAECESVKIGGIVKSSNEVLDKIIGLLLQQGAGEQIKIKLDNLAQAKGINSQVAYLTSSLYNLAIDFEKQNKHLVSQFPAKQQQDPNYGILTHNYTKEELESIYDSLDDIEI